MNRITPEKIISLKDNEIFIFGANLRGAHGAGAAKTAMGWGAKYGQSEGLQGKTYAIPTVNKSISRTLPIDDIRPYVDRFIEFAKQHPELIFLTTEIGCGLAALSLRTLHHYLKKQLI